MKVIIILRVLKTAIFGEEYMKNTLWDTVNVMYSNLLSSSWNFDTFCVWLIGF